MVVHWEQLDDNEWNRWLLLTSEDTLASYGQAVDRLNRVNNELSRFGIIFHPFKLVFRIFEQVRMIRYLMEIRKAFKEYERSLSHKYKMYMDDGEKDQMFLIAFPNRTFVLELDRRGAEQLQRVLRDIGNI